MADEEMRMMMEMKSDISSIKGILSTMANTNEVAIKAFESAQSAHHRLNEIKKEKEAMKKDFENDVRDMKSNQKWLIGTTISVVGLFFAAIGLLWKVVSG